MIDEDDLKKNGICPQCKAEIIFYQLIYGNCPKCDYAYEACHECDHDSTDGNCRDWLK